jgi:hypothetical protein
MHNPDDTSFEALTAALLLGAGGLQSHIIEQLQEEDLAHCMFIAATQGNVELMKAMWEQRGPFPVVYENEPGWESERLNGKVFVSKKEHLLVSCPTPADVKLLFQTILSYGIKGLLEPGPTFPFLFREAALTLVANAARNYRFSGELPFLDAGFLQWPELALALEDEGQRRLMPEAYRPMLCWATPQMLEEHGSHLAPLRASQQVTYTLNSLRSRSPEPVEFCVPMSEFTAYETPAEDVVIDSIALGVQSHSDHSESVGTVFHVMAPSEQHYGFEDRQGRILCETRADFLLGFAASSVNEANMEAAQRLNENRFPLDVLSNHIAKVCFKNFGYHRDVFAFVGGFTRDLISFWRPSSRGFFYLFAEDEVMDKKLVAMMRRDQWIALLGYCEPARMEPHVLLALRDVHGIGNQNLRFTLQPQYVDELHSAGYRFDSGTRVVKCPREMTRFVQANPGKPYVYVDFDHRLILMHNGHWAFEAVFGESQRLHSLAHAMNLWTGAGDQPKGAQASLDDLVRLETDDVDAVAAMGTWAHLVKMGVDVCVEAASCTEHWKWIVKMFSVDQLLPHLALMPRESRGRVLENELGL